jgi:hypothetical protein
MSCSPYNLDHFLEALQNKTWIEILRATQDEIHSLPRPSNIDQFTAYLDGLKRFEAYLLNPRDPLPEQYKTVIRNMRVAPEPRQTKTTGKAKAASG